MSKEKRWFIPRNILPVELFGAVALIGGVVMASDSLLHLWLVPHWWKGVFLLVVIALGMFLLFADAD